MTGTVLYEDASPAAGASLTVTSHASGLQVAVITADRTGRFMAPIDVGDYAFAIAAEHGALWVEKLTISTEDITFKLTDECHAVAGRIAGPGGDEVDVQFVRYSRFTGDTFVTRARRDQRFSLCLPPGQYGARLAGSMLSTGLGVAVPSEAEVVIQGYPTTSVKSAPSLQGKLPHDIGGLVADIMRSGPRIVALGEATHGSAEFIIMRAKLVFELARRSGLRLLLLENDAIAGMALERYVNGQKVNLPKAVADLGFWTTDTHEFQRFLDDIRTYNLAQSAHTDRIHIWGIDVQNTALPAALLLSHAAALGLSEEDEALLRSIAPDRGKGVRQLAPERRAKLDILLSRLASTTGTAEVDTQLAVAARSLAIQLRYWADDDSQGQYASLRDSGMAQLARFIIERTGVSQACLWAHNDHIVKAIGDGVARVGHKIAMAFPGRYYAVGFFLFEGSTRAWDPAGRIGVISHKLKPAPAYTVEGAVMAATGAPEVAWLALRSSSATLQRWLATPRYVRELGAVYQGEDSSMVLLDVPAAFDALVVTRTVHDTSPTPSGVRRAKS